MACNLPRDPEVEKAFWNEAKGMLSRGIEPEDVIGQLAKTHGIGTDAVGSVLTNRQMFMLTNEAWAKQAKLANLRSTAKRAALAADDPKWLKVLKGAYELPRRSLTVYHGGVIPFTHARSSLAIPGEMKIFGRAVKDAYSYMTPNTGAARWRADMAKLRTDPQYNFWQRAGLDIKLQSQPVGMGMSRWTRQSFDALKTMRIELAKKYWDQLPSDARSFEAAQDLSKRINHATGTVASPPIINKLAGATMFAPKLRFAKYASVADALTSKFGAQRFAKVAAVNLGLLAVNDMVNKYVLGQNDEANRVNWLHPERADWLRAKAFGMTIPMSPLLETGKLPLAAGSVMLNPNEENKSKVLMRELSSAAHPAISTGISLATGKDFATGKTLPFKGASQYLYGEHRGEKKMFGKFVKNKYQQTMTPGEYVSGFAPIPAQTALKAMTQEGIPPSIGQQFLESILSGGAGTHAYPNIPYKNKP